MDVLVESCKRHVDLAHLVGQCKTLGYDCRAMVRFLIQLSGRYLRHAEL